jgi:hypothetical protein
MYPEGTAGQIAKAEQSRKLDITLRENIDTQIVVAEKRVKELQDARSRLEKSGILDTRIDDIQNAMRW